MARPPKQDRAKVKSVTLTLKLTASERERLHDLVAAREAELRKQTGQHIDLSASSYIRWLMDQDAERRGLGRRGAKPRAPRVR